MLQHILHTGLAVPNLEQAVEFYKSLNFSVVKQFHKPEPDADVAVVEGKNGVFELWQFNDTTHSQVEFIRNHVAIYSDDLEEDVQALQDAGYTLTIPITEGVTLRYAFVQDSAGTNYEVATDNR